MVADAMSADPSLSLAAGVKRVGGRVGVVPDTSWVRQIDMDTRGWPTP